MYGPLIAVSLAAGAAPAPARQIQAALTGDAAANYRPVASYDLAATLDPANHTVTGSGRITWTNTQALPVQELWWHLYLNAFRNDRSTFLIESQGRLRDSEFERG